MEPQFRELVRPRIYSPGLSQASDYKNVEYDFQSYCTSSYCVCCISRLCFLPSFSFLFLPSLFNIMVLWQRRLQQGPRSKVEMQII